MPEFVDFFSDTKTRPTAAMRAAMANADVGDERADEDPSVNRLVARCAELLGKPAALYLPSGTMCNEIALAVHCRPGDEVLCDRTSHLIGFDILTVSGKVWKDMSADQQAKFQAAADKAIAFSTEKHLAREKELVDLFKSKGLNIYTPDVDAFRKYAQEQYLASDLAKDWPAGMVDKINAL